MKILVIPDIHGRQFWKLYVDKIDNYDKIVFLGDYVDPYGPENISENDAITNFIDIIEFKKKFPSKVVLLLGNHDLHYASTLFYQYAAGGRISIKYFNDIKQLFIDNHILFQIAYDTPDILFTHAGFIKEWADKYNINPTADALNSFWDKNDLSCFTDISYIRGGNSNAGSCVWSDVSEKMQYDENNKLINITGVDKYQIFGHTLQINLDDYKKQGIWSFGKPIINKYWSMLDTAHAYEVDDDDLPNSIHEILE